VTIELRETFASDASQLAGIRSTVRGWLAPYTLAPERLDEVVLAVNEAAALALLVGDEASRLAVEVFVEGSRMTAQVTFWHSHGPMTDAEVSRPLLWICALMPHVEIDSHADRTTLRMTSPIGPLEAALQGGVTSASRSRASRVIAFGTRAGRSAPEPRALRSVGAVRRSASRL